MKRFGLPVSGAREELEAAKRAWCTEYPGSPNSVRGPHPSRDNGVFELDCGSGSVDDDLPHTYVIGFLSGVRASRTKLRPLDKSQCSCTASRINRSNYWSEFQCNPYKTWVTGDCVDPSRVCPPVMERNGMKSCITSEGEFVAHEVSRS